MSKLIILREVFQYVYSSKVIKSEEFLSDKICCYTVGIRKKIVNTAKWLIVYGDFILRFTNGVVSSQAIGLTILAQNPGIIRLKLDLPILMTLTITIDDSFPYCIRNFSRLHSNFLNFIL